MGSENKKKGKWEIKIMTWKKSLTKLKYSRSIILLYQIEFNSEKKGAVTSIKVLGGNIILVLGPYHKLNVYHSITKRKPYGEERKVIEETQRESDFLVIISMGSRIHKYT